MYLLYTHIHTSRMCTCAWCIRQGYMHTPLCMVHPARIHAYAPLCMVHPARMQHAIRRGVVMHKWRSLYVCIRYSWLSASPQTRIWGCTDSREQRDITRSVSHYSVFRPKSELVGKVLRRIVSSLRVWEIYLDEFGVSFPSCVHFLVACWKTNLPLSNWIDLTLVWDNRVVLWYTSLVCWQSFNLRKRLWLLVLRHLPECNCALWVNLTLRLRPI